MPNITLVWVSKGRSFCRTFFLPKILVCVVALVFFFSLCVSITGFFWAQALYRQTVVQKEQHRILENRLTEKNVFLQTQMRETIELREEKQLILGELREILSKENKIRRFLGLNERPSVMERSNQGGMGPSGAVRFLEQGFSPMGGLSIEGEGNFFEYSQSLRSGLQEVLAYLKEKHLESRRIPTLLPVTSDKVWLSGRFAWRQDPMTGTKREFHYGIDLAGPWKSPIIAPADGKVLKAGKDRYLGVYVKLKHSDKVSTLYGHLASATVQAGQEVKRGDVIGYMGNSGRSTGTHLHYSVTVDDKHVDPLDFVWDRPFKSLNL